MLRGKGPVWKLVRRDKAAMIEAVLTAHLGREPQGLRMLDIGCGNGDISQHFSRRNEQYAVDVADRRRPENDAFRFARVTSERLPFDDGYFDVVVSNHVLEHVSDQRLHLAEIGRVLKPGGCAYLATPNRSSPIMPGHAGNDRVLRYAQMEPLFAEMGFRAREYSTDLLRRPREFQSGHRWLAWVPAFLLRSLRRLYPSHVFVLEPRR